MARQVLRRVKPRQDTPRASSDHVRRRMQATRRTGTEAEHRLCEALKELRLRYAVDRSPIPEIRSRADILFPSAHVAVFVDGCFWHCCPIHGTCPKINRAWWRAKLAANRRRDARINRLLRKAGWIVLRFWEHQALNSPDRAANKIATYVVAKLSDRGEQHRDLMRNS
jgi:DNA mismatch endonuclease (patch repair protein)